jgi:hypothetical protein
MLFGVFAVVRDELSESLNVGVAAHLPSVVMVALLHHKALPPLLVVTVVHPLCHLIGHKRVLVSKHKQHWHTELLH